MNREADLLPMITIVKPGQCDNCLGNIVIIDNEMSMIRLSENGFPVETESLYQVNHGFCQKCGKRFEMVKVGLGYEKYSRTSELYREYLKKNNKFTDCDKDIRTENPFATITRRYKNV